MKKMMILAAMMAISGVAHAGMGIPNLPAQPIAAQGHSAVIGQSLPVFAGRSTALASQPLSRGVVGESAVLPGVMGKQALIMACKTPQGITKVCG
jgi:hypothetical protein